ncbi:hypothetical protein D915_000649 [Fasciola hepatica]|uniref:Ionotropic glutamate receptor L-glutamate and glycine-binding domain-containing protein n=1 Tax=Fasciola hepatica TaxID=6192 RepID=A0A4E0RKZ8_FASHE|nr:hypothetical protein D915_000649 [Fasciola hepatica]
MTVNYSYSSINGYFLIYQTVCQQILAGTMTQPDVMINLVRSPESQFLLRRLSFQFGTGLISSYAIPYLEQNFESAKWSISNASTVSIGFAPQTPVNAAESFAHNLHNLTACGATLFMPDEVSNGQSHRNAEDLSFIENHVVPVSENTSTAELKNIAHKVFVAYSSHVWIFALPRVHMIRLISSIQNVSGNQSALDGIFVVFDTNINTSDCRALCQTNLNQTEICNPLKPGNKIYCVKLDLSEANHSTVNLISQVLATRWRSYTIDQIDILLAYETILTAGLAIDSLVREEQWPALSTSTLTKATVCHSGSNSNVKTTRYNSFLMRVTQVRLNELWVVKSPTFSSSRNRELLLHFQHPPFVVKTETGWDGYCVEVFKLVADRLNLTYQFVEQLDGKYGSPLPGGYWDGIVGSIIEKKAKVGIGPIIVNSEAREVVDFTRPYLPSSGILILMRRTRENMVAPLFFIYLFSEYVWIVCGVLILVVASGAWACELISPYQPNTDRDPVSFVERVSFCRLFDMVSFVTASWAGQGEYCEIASTLNCERDGVTKVKKLTPLRWIILSNIQGLRIHIRGRV